MIPNIFSNAIFPWKFSKLSKYTTENDMTFLVTKQIVFIPKYADVFWHFKSEVDYKRF